MKCKECYACRKGWFPSKPNDYVCTGVKEPFVIEDVNVDCTEYDEIRSMKSSIIVVRTNADIVRSMDDQELAEFIAEGKYNNKDFDMDEVCHKGMCLDGETCAGCMLKWLQKPV